MLLQMTNRHYRKNAHPTTNVQGTIWKVHTWRPTTH